LNAPAAMSYSRRWVRRHWLEVPLHRLVSGEQDAQVGEASFELTGPVGQGPGVPGGVVEGLAHVTEPLRGLLGDLSGGENHALEAAGLLLEGEQPGQILGGEGRQAQRYRVEGLPPAERRELAFPSDRELDGVVAGHDHGAGRRASPGAVRVVEAGRIEARVAEIPGDAVNARRNRARDPPHDFPGLVPHDEQDPGILLTILGSHLVPARLGHVRPGLPQRVLGLLPHLTPGLQRVAQVVGEDRAEGRVRGAEDLVAGIVASVPARHEHPRALDREELSLFGQGRLADLPER
jgi:hypothetical protein